MVTHNPEYLKYGTHIIHLKDGKIEKEEKGRHAASVKSVEGFDAKRLELSNQ